MQPERAPKDRPPFAAAGTDFFPEVLHNSGPENLLYEKDMDPARWQQRVARLEQVLEPRFEGNPDYACGANPEAACALTKAAAIIDQWGNHSNPALHYLKWAVDVLEAAKPADGRLYCRTLISRGRYEVQQGEIAAAEKTLAKATALAGQIDGANWRCDDMAKPRNQHHSCSRAENRSWEGRRGCDEAGHVNFDENRGLQHENRSPRSPH